VDVFGRVALDQEDAIVESALAKASYGLQCGLYARA
jgi:hypothetical protein